MINVLILVVESKDDKPTEGEKLEKVSLNELVDSDCPQCGKSPVLIYERVLIEGSLENYHLMHTEVEDFYAKRGSRTEERRLRAAASLFGFEPNIGGLDIAMNHLLGVNVGNYWKNFDQEVANFLFFK